MNGKVVQYKKINTVTAPSHKGLDTRQHTLNPCTSFKTMYPCTTKPKQAMEHRPDLLKALKHVERNKTNPYRKISRIKPNEI
jgi:hypothetical protein